MKKELLFDLKSPYRNNFQVWGFRFGAGKPAAAIVGAMRGDEAQQQFIGAQVVKTLGEIEARGLLAPGLEILVIPSANHFSMNIQKRFWAMDNTDINRMFPGYDHGETTQRIAAALFGAVKGYAYGIQLASFYLPGEFIPHIRVMENGYQDVSAAQTFGLPYVLLRSPTAFDTALLSYNWQIFGTRAFSLYSGATAEINEDSARLAVKAVLRFLARKRFVKHDIHDGYAAEVIRENELHSVTSARGGMLYRYRRAGDDVAKDELLATILDPYDGAVLSEIHAPVSGTIFFSHHQPQISQNTLAYRLVEYS